MVILVVVVVGHLTSYQVEAVVVDILVLGEEGEPLLALEGVVVQ